MEIVEVLKLVHPVEAILLYVIVVTGDFYGCTNYPKCRFTQEIEE